MRLPAKQPNGCQLQGAKDWAPSRTSGTSRPSIAEAMECLRIPRSSFARQHAKKHLVCGARGREEWEGGQKRYPSS